MLKTYIQPFAFCGSLLLVSSGVLADTPRPYYASIGFSQFEYKDNDIDQDVSLDLVVMRLGQTFSKYFSGEIRAGFGVNQEDFGGTNSNQTLELDRYYGAYMKAGLPIANFVYPYLTAGYTESNLKFEQGETQTTDSRSGFSYGVGTNFIFSDAFEINLEYMSYFDKENEQIRGAQITISAPFSD